MESIQKIYAIIKDRNQGGSGEGGNCKVIAFIRNKEFIKDEETISEYFQTDCKIFSSKLFSGINSLSINDLIEIVPISLNTEVDAGNNYYVKHKPVKKTGSLIIDVPFDYLKTNYINLEDLNNYFESKEYFKEELGNFYLCDNEKIFGPFKTTDSKIQPKKDTFVHSFQYNIEDLIEVENYKFNYLLQEPKVSINVIDCMTVNQLMDFLKKQLVIDRADINLISKTYNEIKSLNVGNSSLDKVRLERASNYLDELMISYAELKKISTKQNEWGLLFNKIITENKQTFEEETLKEIDLNIQKKENHKNQLQTEIKLKHNELNKLTFECTKAHQEIEDIKAKKEDLILTLQIAAGITNNSSSSNTNVIKDYFELIISKNPSNLNELDDFYDQFQNVIISKKSLLKESLYILKEKRFLIGNSIALTLNAIQHIGSFEIMVQNTEPDWLKYKFLEENGLSTICQKANKNVEVPHFFILQDFNLASFECYGKPILDIANGIRSNIPGTLGKWPTNLFFILITVDPAIDDFGFSLNKSTFKNWAFLPDVDNYSYQKIQANKGINLNSLITYNQHQDYSSKYFI